MRPSAPLPGVASSRKAAGTPPRRFRAGWDNLSQLLSSSPSSMLQRSRAQTPGPERQAHGNREKLDERRRSRSASNRPAQAGAEQWNPEQDQHRDNQHSYEERPPGPHFASTI